VLARGEPLTAAHAAVVRAFGVRARVLPMSDHPVRTRVMAHGRWWSFQELMIRARGAGPVQDVDFAGARAASPTPEVLDAIATARAIAIGPSNPIISIGPMLALDGLKRAVKASPAPVVAVSPLVRNQVVKGPTEAFMEWAGQPLTADGVVACYEGLIDGLVADERAAGVPVLETDVLLDAPPARRRVAEATLRFALALG
jgi:LPPG:FO 2-phospho-L-lactate transferase